MQRLCALLLLTLSAWLLVAPLATLSTAEENLLPACCRRLGTHHCAANMHAAVDRQHASFRSVGCLLMPRHAPAMVQKLAALAASAGFVIVACWSAFVSITASESYARALSLRSPRGPPRLSFA